jgi:DNA processing protein
MNERGLLDLVISLLPGLKLVEKIMLIQTFDNIDQLFVQSKRDIELIINRQIDNYWDISEIFERAGRIDTVCKMRSIKWVSWTDAGFPPLLREIYDPPAVIYYRGELPNPEKSLLGMVGTRKPSSQSAEQAYKIAGNLSRLGISIVSGLALGIDSMAHRGNLVGTSPAYAVLGSGIDDIYPSSNRNLARRILDSGGSLISEYHPGIRPCKWTFPARNRIIAALARSVLIVEAPEKSGALITASFALEMGKDLWVASKGIEEGFCDRRGTIQLSIDGAEIIHSAIDVIDKWNMIEADAEMVQPNQIDRSDYNPNDFNPTTRELINSMADLLKIDM